MVPGRARARSNLKRPANAVTRGLSHIPRAHLATSATSFLHAGLSETDPDFNAYPSLQRLAYPPRPPRRIARWRQLYILPVRTSHLATIRGRLQRPAASGRSPFCGARR